MPYPPPACDMGYVAFCTYSGLDAQVRFMAFDTLHTESGMYNYGVNTVQGTWGRYSMPCVSRTPGDVVHVTWKVYDAGQNFNSVDYSTAAMNPASIRVHGVPPFTPRFEISEWTVQGSYPTNGAYSDYVTGAWRAGAPLDVGVTKKNRHSAYADYWQWFDFGQWSEGQGEAGYPAMSRYDSPVSSADDTTSARPVLTGTGPSEAIQADVAAR